MVRPAMQIYCMHEFLNGIIWMEAGEPGILITHGFLNRWYFTGSISGPGSGFIGLIGALSGKSAGGFCGERSCLTGGKVVGVNEEKNGRGGGTVPLTYLSRPVTHAL